MTCFQLIRVGVLTKLSDSRMIGTDGERKEGKKEMFYLTTHSTHCIYGYMASDIW